MSLKNLPGVFIIWVALCMYSLNVSGQVILPYSEIEKRMQQGGDTTYVLNFWATWCGPCIRELPYFDRIHQEAVSDRSKVKVLLLSLDFKSKYHSALLPFIGKHNLQSEIIVLDEQDMDSFINRVDKSWSGAIPATLLFSGSGRRDFYEQEFTYKELKTIINQKP